VAEEFQSKWNSGHETVDLAPEKDKDGFGYGPLPVTCPAVCKCSQSRWPIINMLFFFDFCV